MNILQSIILGIVEGITEFLPISSTGHLILTSKLFGIENASFTKSFEIAIQFGAILAVVVLYWKKLFGKGVPSSLVSPGHSGSEEPSGSMRSAIWKKVLVAFLPTAVLGFLFYKILKDFLLENTTVVLWSLLLGGLALIIFELWYRKQDTDNHAEDISYKKSFLIGIFQALAIIPGVSRAGATIIGGLAIGIKRQAIVEFSFLLAVPTMAAATAFDLYKSANSFSFGEFHVLAIGFVVSFGVAILAIKWLLNFIKNHTFIPFGVYRIVVAVLFWVLVVR